MSKPLGAFLVGLALSLVAFAPQRVPTIVMLHNETDADLVVYVVRPPHLIARLGEVAARSDERFPIPEFFAASTFFVHIEVRGGTQWWDSHHIEPSAHVGIMNITVSVDAPVPDTKLKAS